MKTSELLLHAGPVGMWWLQLTDADPSFIKQLTRSFGLLEIAQYKTSTAGDREVLRSELANVFAELELMVPMYFMTMVNHVLVFHTVDTLNATGPFQVASMLSCERFNCVLKGLAKGTKNVMESILANYLLLDVSLSNRLDEDKDWTCEPVRSSTASYLQRPDSQNKTDRMWSLLGKTRMGTLSDDEAKVVQGKWRSINHGYDKFNVAYAKYAYKKGPRSDAAEHISVWSPRGLTAEQRLWQQMSPEIEVTLCSVLI